MEKTLRMEVKADETFLLPSVAILATSLEFIWENRKVRKTTTLYMMRADLDAAVSIRRRLDSDGPGKLGTLCYILMQIILWFCSLICSELSKLL